MSAPEDVPHAARPDHARRGARLLPVAVLAGACGFAGAAVAIKLVPAPIGTRPEETAQAFREVARRIRPTVVHLTRERVVAEETNPLQEVFDRYFNESPSPKRSRKEKASGTGFLVRADGLCLTNNHVAGGGGKLRAKLYDGREVDATVVGADSATDVAVVKLAGEGFSPAELGDSDQVAVGDWSLAFGCPFGLEVSMTVGVISAKGRSRVGIAAYEDFLQTDAAINPGNSGGPLVDIQGRVIGINTAIASSSGGYQGVGFTIPITMARAIMESLLSSGHVVRGWLGVQLDASEAATERPARAGALVRLVSPGGPAALAGIAPGDVVVSFDGKPVEDGARLRLLAAAAPVGRVVPVRVVRDGKEVELSLTVAERTLDADPRPGSPRPDEPPSLGITAKKLTPELLARFELPKDSAGVVVVEVAPGSPAAEAGLKAGQLLRSIDGRPIRVIEDLDQAIARLDPRAGVKLVVADAAGEKTVVVRARS